MSDITQKELIKLVEKEGWEVDKKVVFKNNKEIKIPIVWAADKEFPLCHPYQIYLNLYRDEGDVERKFLYMKSIHDWLWPHHIKTWHYWTEERFLAHCAGYTPIVLASGAGGGKSLDVAKIATIFWLSDPKNNSCVIASTTLDSLESRIWGYVMTLVHETALPIYAKAYKGKPPKIMYPGQMDKIHGMFAVAIRNGDDEKVVSTLIGRHPNKRFMAVLDEATDMNPAIIKVIANWQQGVEFFQMWAIGNSKSVNDLHGALATPKHKLAFESVDPNVDIIWKTKHDNGVCLYFNPHRSPAIHEKDPAKKIALGKFLITEEKLEELKEQYGEHTTAYNRFVLGFWSQNDADETIISKQFLNENDAEMLAEWSGFIPLEMVAGLDPALRVGGTGCILRLAYYGQMTNGSMALDYRKNDLLFRINITANNTKSGELQLAEQVAAILTKYNIPINRLAIDTTGIGRAFGELLKMVMRATADPIRIVSVGNRWGARGAGRPSKVAPTDPFIITKTPSDMWFDFRSFLQTKQIKGLDDITIQQMTNRLVELKGGKVILESKDKYKARMAAISPKHAHSPDEADTCVLVLQAAIIALGFVPGQVKQLPNLDLSQRWGQKMFAYVQENMRLEAENTRGNNRPLLVPNFSQTIEESLDN